MYNNLAETERTYLHEDIALTLEAMYGERAKNIAPQLAWHFEQAGNVEKTFEYLLLAGQQAQVLGSNKEALVHFERGLTIINQLPVTTEFLRVELNLQAGLGTALLTVEGLKSARMQTALERALELCHQIGGTDNELMAIYAGLASGSSINNDLPLQTCLDWLEKFREIAAQQKDLTHLAAAESFIALIYAYIGNHDKALEMGRSILIYSIMDQDKHENMIRHYTIDTRVLLRPTLCWALYPKGKLKEMKTLLGKEPLPNFQHVASKAIFLTASLYSYQYLSDFTSLKSASEELLKLAEEYGMPAWKTMGLVFHGWTISQLGEVEAGIAEMQQGIDITKMSGCIMFGSLLFAMSAEGIWLMGRHHDALDMLEEGFTYSKRKGEFCYLSQLNCIKGEWLQKLGAKAAEVEFCFREAINVAKEQEAPLLELQASLSLAKYWQANNQKEEAHSLLKELLDRVTPIIDIDLIPEYAEAQEILALQA